MNKSNHPFSSSSPLLGRGVGGEAVALLSTAYLPPVEYFTKLLTYDRILIEQYDHYQKQTYRNRCTIAAPDGPLALTVPTVKPDTPKALLRDIRISDHGNWRHLHWNALESAYNHTPFFEYYRDDFRPFYEQKYEFLMDFNEALLHLTCELIDIDIEERMERTEHFRDKGQETRNEEQDRRNEEQGLVTCSSSLITEDDFRDIIHPKRDYTIEDPAFHPEPYYQVFQQRLGFLPNLSIVDLLFNMGPESLLVLQKCIRR